MNTTGNKKCKGKKRKMPPLSALLIGLLQRYLLGTGLAQSALAVEVTEEELAAMPEPLRAFYAKSDEDPKKFELDPDKIVIPDTTKLENALREERAERAKSTKAMNDMILKYKDIDPEKYKDLVGKLEADEEGRLFGAGKKDELRKLWFGKMTEEHTREIEAERKKTAAALESRKKYEQRVLDNHLLQAANKGVDKLRVVPSALDDILLQGRQVFSLDDDANAVMRDKDGNVIPGKNGSSPYTAEDWLAEQVEKRPHWFEYGSSGGGGAGNRGSESAGSGRTIARSKFLQLTPQEQHDTVVTKGVRVVDDNVVRH